MTTFPYVRMRRLRNSTEIRNLLEVPFPTPDKFIWPVFVRRGRGIKESIPSLPGQHRYSLDTLLPELERLRKMGIGGILLFGLPDEEKKDNRGSGAASPTGIIPEAIKAIRREIPELVAFTDLCLCAYTEHGHCGPLNNLGNVDNDRTLESLAEAALIHAEAGVHGIAPSAMMDGQVLHIRKVLDAGGFHETLIMSYSTKFASSLYGPFREAEESAPSNGDRKGYQQPCGDARQALRESLLDEAEGADILMVKPGLFYLDILARLRQETRLPLAAYSVSGEYAMILAAARQGILDAAETARESLVALSRAGSDLLITYWANRYNEIIRGEISL